jgi:raffinose synthase
MFQSGHPAGAFHAAARAISGCAVYVSDKPEAHDFALLRKLVLSDGSVPRADGIGRPTRDCLFHDPTREDVLLKIFNRNGNSGVVGIFNARYHEEAAAQTEIAGTVGPSDVEGLAGESFAVYLHTAQTLTTCTREDRLPLSLPELSFELCTFVPIVDGYAPIGLTDKFNSAGTIISAGRDTAGHYIVSLCDGGDFLTWCATRPSAVTVNDVAVSCDYDEASHGLSVNMPANGSCVVRMAP